MRISSTHALLFLALLLPFTHGLAQTETASTLTAAANVYSAGCPVSFSVQLKSYSAMSRSNLQLPGTPEAVVDFDAELARATLQRQQDLASLTDLQQNGAEADEVAQAKQRLQTDDSDIETIQQRIDRTIPKAKFYIGQGVLLTFSQTDANRISKAAVTIHGTSRTLQTISAAADAPEDSWTRSYIMECPDGASALSPREFRTKAVAAANWVEITEIDFVDGTIWKGRPEAGCVRVAEEIATPSRYVNYMTSSDPAR